MFEESTNGLNLVAKAIETGKFDDQAYQKVANHLQSLAANGPWGASTARDSIKKWAEGVPLLGNLVKALFDDPIENDPFGPNGYCRKYP
jgi:hypothetical protein